MAVSAAIGQGNRRSSSCLYYGNIVDSVSQWSVIQLLRWMVVSAQESCATVVISIRRQLQETWISKKVLNIAL